VLARIAEHHDGKVLGVGVLPDAAQCLDAVQAAHVDVEHDKLRGLVVDGVEGRFSVFDETNRGLRGSRRARAHHPRPKRPPLGSGVSTAWKLDKELGQARAQVSPTAADLVHLVNQSGWRWSQTKSPMAPRSGFPTEFTMAFEPQAWQENHT
jgi:hypothetical protein